VQGTFKVKEYLVKANLHRLCSACGSTHTESGKLYRKVKHRSPPKSFLTPTAKARPDQAALATFAGARGTTWPLHDIGITNIV